MPVVHHSHKQIHLKIVYYGPGLGGKTTNLKYIHAQTRPELRGKLLSLNTETERTLFFDLLPVELGDFRGYSIRLHLCTVPGQIAYDKTRQLILRHVDGVVFVADSQEFCIDANIESVSNLETNLALLGEDATRIPLVIQYNKRDVVSALPVEVLRSQLGVPQGVAEVEAVAREGRGVFETMKLIVKSCLTLLGDPAQAPDGRSPSILPGARASMFPGGRPPGLYGEGSGELVIPPSPAVPRFDPPPPPDDDDTPSSYRLTWSRSA